MIIGLYAALLAFVYFFLSAMVIAKRRKLLIGLGSNDNRSLEKIIRAHGNFAEYVPFALILLWMNETTAANSIWLHSLGLSLLLARVLHAQGIYQSAGTSFGRFIGTVLSFSVILVSAVRLVLINL